MKRSNGNGEGNALDTPIELLLLLLLFWFYGCFIVIVAEIVVEVVAAVVALLEIVVVVVLLRAHWQTSIYQFPFPLLGVSVIELLILIPNRKWGKTPKTNKKYLRWTRVMNLCIALFPLHFVCISFVCLCISLYSFCISFVFLCISFVSLMTQEDWKFAFFALKKSLQIEDLVAFVSHVISNKARSSSASSSNHRDFWKVMIS